ncbi:MAG: glycoside hydrolase family 16 protein [Bacteroidetes bacterium]|nr:glycoside hydrolase family 16 protein [Bacteroidota bacterium]MDA1333020.1 glycoside hydrolase family 16 protein [Bacteroidota bacterium]
MKLSVVPAMHGSSFLTQPDLEHMLNVSTFRSYLLLLALALAGCDSSSDTAEEETPIDAPPGWSLVWNDEFNGSSIDATKWNHEVNANGGGNNELQYYTARKKNSFVENGHLVIEAHEERFTDVEGTRDYTSARMTTRGRGDWTYGRFEIRARLPKGQGIWPAIWMMPTASEYGGWAASGEIDIMEIIGSQPDLLHGTLHFGGTHPNNQSSGASYQLPAGSLSSDFHTYAVEWQEGEIRWYIDDVLYSTKTEWNSANGPYPAPFDKDFFIILNVAVGGNWPGSPNASTLFPQRMEVDFVRVYEVTSN